MLDNDKVPPTRARSVTAGLSATANRSFAYFVVRQPTKLDGVQNDDRPPTAFGSPEGKRGLLEVFPNKSLQQSLPKAQQSKSHSKQLGGREMITTMAT